MLRSLLFVSRPSSTRPLSGSHLLSRTFRHKAKQSTLVPSASSTPPPPPKSKKADAYTTTSTPRAGTASPSTTTSSSFSSSSSSSSSAYYTSSTRERLFRIATVIIALSTTAFTYSQINLDASSSPSSSSSTAHTDSNKAALAAHGVHPSHPDQRPLVERLADAHRELEALLHDRFTTDIDDRAQHGKDAYSYHKDNSSVPFSVVYPLTTEEVSAIAKICYQYGIVMIPYGSGTSLEGHTTAPEGGITIDLSRMSSLVQLHQQDMDCVVQAGITWNHLNDLLKPHGLFYAVDPGPGGAIGGGCANNSSGTNAVRYGSTRYNILNMTVVLPNGEIIKTANRARKSSAGYDLTRFFIGSEGTLGIITEVTVKLHNIPEVIAVGTCNFPSIADAANATIHIMQKGVQLGCIELLDEECIKVVNQYAGFNPPYEEKPTIFFKFTGSSAKVDDDVRSVSELIKPYGAGPFVWAQDQKTRDKIWEARKGALWGCMSYRPGAEVWTTDVCVPISKLAECVELTKEDLQTYKVPAAIVGHVGDGNFHVLMMVKPDDKDEMKRAAAVNDRMVHRAISMEGTCTGEHGVGVGKKEFLPDELGEPAIDLMRTIKKAIDPYNIMNPGKIFDLDATKKSSHH